MKRSSNSSANLDKLDDIIEQFELHWSPDENFLDLAIEHLDALNTVESLSELLRSDIDLRYRSGIEVDLGWYWKRFTPLQDNAVAWRAIAFEDYRARKSHGLSLDRSRWSTYPQLHQESWFQQLDAKRVGKELETGGRNSNSTESLRASRVAIEENETPEIGRGFGEFHLHALLGAGAFSKVYLATQPFLASRYVALKVVNRPLNEPTHLARLQHTGIVPLYSLHRIGSYSALCMPYYGAATLADMLGEQTNPSFRNGQSLVRTVRSALNRITVDTFADTRHGPFQTGSEENEVSSTETTSTVLLDRISQLSSREFPLWFANKTAAALAHAHDRQVIHGDLKPANILIRNDGEPALIDFNLSQSSYQEASAIVGGTLPYMSPEQMRSLLGRESTMSPASDIFSFGVVMFQLIEGKLPYDAPASAADSDVEVAVLARKSLVAMHSRLVSPGLKSIVSKCLSWDPSQRYSNASDLLVDLECETAHFPLKHSHESFALSRIPKAIRRNRKLFSILPLTMGLVLATAISCWLGWQWRKQTQTQQAFTALSRWQDSKVNYIDLISVGNSNEFRDQLESIDHNLSLLLSDSGTLSSESKYWPWWTSAERESIASDLGAACYLAYEIGSSKHRKSSTEIDAVLRRWNTILEGHQNQIAPSQLRTCLKLLEVRRRRMMGDIPEAEEILSQCEPDSLTAPIYWIAKGELFAVNRQHAAALIAYEQAIEAAPATATPYVQRAQLREQLGNLDLAEKDYTRAMEFHPGRATLLADRARVRSKLEKWDEAISDMNQAIEILPAANRFYLSRSRMLLKSNRAAEARADYLHAMRSEPQSPEDWISRALAHLPKNPKLAMSDLRSAETMEPGRIDVLQNQAHVLNDYDKNIQGAVDALSRILESAPNNEMARADRAVLLACLGRETESIGDIEELFEFKSRLDASTVYQIGCAYAQLSRQNQDYRIEAVRYLSRAIFRGYGGELLGTDSHLDPLREDTQFQSLVSLREIANNKPSEDFGDWMTSP